MTEVIRNASADPQRLHSGTVGALTPVTPVVISPESALAGPRGAPEGWRGPASTPVAQSLGLAKAVVPDAPVPAHRREERHRLPGRNRLRHRDIDRNCK